MDNLDYIENYFSNQPDPARIIEFEQRIQADPAFAEEVAFYLSALGVSRDASQAEKKQHFKKIYQKHHVVSAFRVKKLIYYFAAAALVAGVIFGIYTFVNPISPPQLAGQYEKEHLQTLPVTMSSRSNSLQNGLRLYNEGNFDEALLQFESIIRSDTSNADAKKLAGIVSLRMKDYKKALGYFNQLETYTGLYSNPALFYQALTLMERNQPGDAREAKLLLQKIVDQDLEGKEYAQEWLRKW